jgi:hypothetical protein
VLTWAAAAGILFPTALLPQTNKWDSSTVNTFCATCYVGVGTLTPGYRLDFGGSGSKLLALDGGGASPNASTLLFGDGTGWKLFVGKRSDGGATKFLTIKDNGTVAIGTTGIDPGSVLDIANNAPNTVQSQLWITNIDTGTSAGSGLIFRLGTSANLIGQIYTQRVSGTPGNYSSKLYMRVNNGTSLTHAFQIDSAGNTGIGYTDPNVVLTKKLQVNGDASFTGTVTGTNIQANYGQDVAEWVPSRGYLEPGTVVVLSRRAPNEVEASSRRYDARVVGVVSARPGIILGEQEANSALVANTGRVRVRVDATTAPIAIGDLLVTSDRDGYAMRSTPLLLGDTEVHRPGTIIGKALEGLHRGVGEILVLLTLQ